MIIDAKDTIAGRVAAFAAKKALEGEKVDIINSEESIITGKRPEVIESWKRKRNKGGPFHGPYLPRQPHMLLKRIIRGMLPYKNERGKKAMKRIMCHIGVPEKLNEKEAKKLEKATKSKLKTARFIKLKELSKSLGAKPR